LARRRRSLARSDVELLSTEHWSLLSTRALGWNEMAGRTQMYLTALSGTVVALALAAQGTDFGPQFVWFALGLLPPLLFIGVVTFVRLVYLNREDARWLQGMNRIRHAYVEASPAIKRHLVTSPYDDDRGLYRTYAAEVPATQHLHALFTTPGMVSVINAVIAAVIVGIAAQLLTLGTALPALVSVAAFAGAFVAHWRYQIRVLAAGTGLAPEFPHPAQPRSRSSARTTAQRVVDECSRSVTGPG
jgi:hypothetical protein